MSSHESPSPTPGPAGSTAASDDPVALKRAQITAWSEKANRVGYLAILAAIIVFVIGFFVGFNSAIIAVVVGLIALSGLLLIPAMIFGYGVKAAEKEERGEKSHF